MAKIPPRPKKESLGTSACKGMHLWEVLLIAMGYGSVFPKNVANKLAASIEAKNWNGVVGLQAQSRPGAQSISYPIGSIY